MLPRVFEHGEVMTILDARETANRRIPVYQEEQGNEGQMTGLMNKERIF